MFRLLSSLIRSLVVAPFRAAAELFGLLQHASASLDDPENAQSQKNKRLSLVASAPAILGLVAFAVVTLSSYTSRSKVQARYLDAFHRSLESDKGSSTIHLAERLFRTGPMNAPEAALDYSRFLASHDELLKANAIIEQIAPDDTPGLPAAHEQRAIAFSKLLKIGRAHV